MKGGDLRRRPDLRLPANETPPAAYAAERRRRCCPRPSRLAAALAVIHGHELARAALWLDAELSITASAQLQARRGAAVVTAPICATHMEDPIAVQRQLVTLVRRLPRAARIAPARSNK